MTSLRKVQLLFIGILACILYATVHASLQVSMFAQLPELLNMPWAVATLWDAYLGFITFFIWVCHKEKTLTKRITWFVAIMLLGNIAMSIYVIWQIQRLPRSATLNDLLTR